MRETPILNGGLLGVGGVERGIAMVSYVNDLLSSHRGESRGGGVIDSG